MAPVVKNPPANMRDIRDPDLIPGLGRSPREGNGNPLQRSCLENPGDRGAWRAAVHGVAKSDVAERLHTPRKFPIQVHGRPGSRPQRGPAQGVGSSLQLRAVTSRLLFLQPEVFSEDGHLSPGWGPSFLAP